jgi:hypothetical protein
MRSAGAVPARDEMATEDPRGGAPLGETGGAGEGGPETGARRAQAGPGLASAGSPLSWTGASLAAVLGRLVRLARVHGRLPASKGGEAPWTRSPRRRRALSQSLPTRFVSRLSDLQAFVCAAVIERDVDGRFKLMESIGRYVAFWRSVADAADARKLVQRAG